MQASFAFTFPNLPDGSRDCFTHTRILPLSLMFLCYPKWAANATNRAIGKMINRLNLRGTGRDGKAFYFCGSQLLVRCLGKGVLRIMPGDLDCPNMLVTEGKYKRPLNSGEYPARVKPLPSGTPGAWGRLKTFLRCQLFLPVGALCLSHAFLQYFVHFICEIVARSDGKGPFPGFVAVAGFLHAPFVGLPQRVNQFQRLFRVDVVFGRVVL